MNKARALCAAAYLLVPSCAVYEDEPVRLGGMSAPGGAAGIASAGATTAGMPSAGNLGATSAGQPASTAISGAAGDEAAGEASSSAGAGQSQGGRAGVGGSSGRASVGGSGGRAGAGGSGGSGIVVGGSNAEAGSSAQAGSAGAAGSTSTPTCSQHPLPVKTSWRASASSYFIGNTAELPALCIDGSSATRWTSGVPQTGNEWLELDFGASATLDQVTLVLGKSSADFPVAYEARVSNEPKDFAAAVLVRGEGAAGTDTVIAFPGKTTGRYLLLSQTGHGSSWWSIAEVAVACTD